MSDLKAAAAKFGNPEVINNDWLDREEARADGAAAVSIPGDQYLMLLAMARNGLRPRLATEQHIHKKNDIRDRSHPDYDACAKCGHDLRSGIHLTGV